MASCTTWISKFIPGGAWKPKILCAEKWPGIAGKPVSAGRPLWASVTVTGAPFVLTPVKETVPSVKTNVGGPKGWEVIVQPVMFNCRWSAPVSTPRLVLKWLQPVRVASPWPPVSNSVQPQKPPIPKGG